MYRFKFDTSTATWIIQLKSSIPFLWMHVVDTNFFTIEEARNYAKTRGLDQYYTEQPAPKDKANFIEHGVQVVLAPSARQ